MSVLKNNIIFLTITVAVNQKNAVAPNFNRIISTHTAEMSLQRKMNENLLSL